VHYSYGYRWARRFQGSGLLSGAQAARRWARGEIIMSTDPMQKFGKEGMDMAMATFGSWTKNAQAIATEFADYSKKSFEDSAAALEKLMGAKNLETAMAVQTEYLKSSYEDFVAESAKIGDLYADLAKEAYKPFEGALAKTSMMK
jgi:phasin family protein